MIYQGAGTAVKERIELLNQQIEKEKHAFDRDKLEDRLGNLSGGVAIINVGANTQLELKERRDRFDDALNATKACLEEGIVAGGGVALLEAKVNLDRGVQFIGNDDIKAGINCVKRALESPILTIVENAGLVGQGRVVMDVITKKNKKGYGYDVKNSMYTNLIKAGIVDPKKVTRVALESAASVAGMVLTTGCAI